VTTEVLSQSPWAEREEVRRLKKQIEDYALIVVVVVVVVAACEIGDFENKRLCVDVWLCGKVKI
jgi:hypothetical protein